MCTEADKEPGDKAAVMQCCAVTRMREWDSSDDSSDMVQASHAGG